MHSLTQHGASSGISKKKGSLRKRDLNEKRDVSYMLRFNNNFLYYKRTCANDFEVL